MASCWIHTNKIRYQIFEEMTLKRGDHHYTAFVGPPKEYDFMGATQFRLLTTLGLRSDHSLLDFGCGSLRSGRILISYLDEGCYCGIEPNEWLINDAIEHQTGKDLLALKKARFNHNSDWQTNVFSQQFDFILSQAVLPLFGGDCIRKALENFHNSLKPDGLIAVTFVEGANDHEGTGRAEGIAAYRRKTLERFAKEAGLFYKRLPWYHPRMTWYLLARDRNRLPTKSMMRHLQGAVLFDSRFTESWMFPKNLRRRLRRFMRRTASRSTLKRIRKIIKF